eukprot:1059579-Prorocentrum_minimum.AAC.2
MSSPTPPAFFSQAGDQAKSRPARRAYMSEVGQRALVRCGNIPTFPASDGSVVGIYPRFLRLM